MSMSKHEIYVKALLRHTDRLTSSGIHGARWNVVDEVVDLENAIRTADLTSRQIEVIRFYRKEFSEEEIAGMIGISQQMVSKHIYSAVRKISNVYTNWEAQTYD